MEKGEGNGGMECKELNCEGCMSQMKYNSLQTGPQRKKDKEVFQSANIVDPMYSLWDYNSKISAVRKTYESQNSKLWWDYQDY